VFEKKEARRGKGIIRGERKDIGRKVFLYILPKNQLK
jgi:hypothetical protein